MFRSALAKYKSSRNLIHYFLLTYIDKIVSFALPLSVLFVLKDKALYATVEVAFSYAVLFMVVMELGISNYLFYGYKKSENKEQFMHSAGIYFKFLLLIYTLLTPVLFFAIGCYDQSLVVLFILIAARAMFTCFISFSSNIYRLKDNPSGVYAVSLIVNVSSFILLCLANFFSLPHKSVYFVAPSLLLILVISIRFIALELKHFNFSGFFDFITRCLKFSWPVILNVLAMSYINNYIKIYAYGHLSQQETIQISYILRIGLIVQLTHSAFASFYSKSLFMDTSHTFNFRIFKQYNIVLLLSAFFVVIAICITNYFFSSQIRIPLTGATFLIILYILLWCYIGYLEIYFGIMNANRKILIYSIISAIVYTFLLLILKNINLITLSLCMVIPTMLNLILVIFGLKKMRILSFNKKSKNTN